MFNSVVYFLFIHTIHVIWQSRVFIFEGISTDQWILSDISVI